MYFYKYLKQPSNLKRLNTEKTNDSISDGEILIFLVISGLIQVEQGKMKMYL